MEDGYSTAGMLLTVLIINDVDEIKSDISNHHMHCIEIPRTAESTVRRHVLSALERRLLENVRDLELKLNDMQLSKRKLKRIEIQSKSVKNQLLQYSTTEQFSKPRIDFKIPPCLVRLLESEK